MMSLVDSANVTGVHQHSPGAQPPVGFRETQRFNGGFILYATGSCSERPYQFLSDPYNIAPKPPEGLHPEKICTPIFTKF